MEIYNPSAIGVSTGFGIPTGGTSGQLLQKVDAANYNTEWIHSNNPTYIFAQNSSGQTIQNNIVPTTIITNWTNIVTNNASEWNATTGVFTATKAGTYLVSTSLTLAANTVNGVGNSFNVAVVKNNTDQALSQYIAETTTSIQRTTGVAQAIVSLAVGDTLTAKAYLFVGGSRTLTTQAALNFLNIQELPNKIIK